VLRGMALYVSKPAIFAVSRGFPRYRRTSKSRLNPKGLHPQSLRWPFAPVAAVADELSEHATRTHDVAAEAPIVSGMAGRYATALFDLASETNTIDAVKADLERFDALVAESADLNRLVRSPVFSADEQGHALGAVLERAGIGGLAAKFLKLLTSNRRLFAVRAMIRAFRELVAQHKGEATAEVTVAEQLNDKHLADLRAALNAVSGKDVDLDIKVDPSIIGGLVVKLGSRMVDTSLRTKLNAIRHAMKEAR
jgi:F-type H+-transporting ATPase subunit delta